MGRRGLGPIGGQHVGHPRLPRLDGQRRVIPFREIGRDDPEEFLRALPVIRMPLHVQVRDGVGRHPLLLHLGHQVGQRVGQTIERRARRKLGLPVQQRRDQLRQFQTQPQVGDGGGQPRHIRARRQIGNQPDARQETRPALGVDLAQPALRAGGVHIDLDAGQRLGRRARHPLGDPCHHGAREIDPDWRGKDSGGVLWVKHRLVVSPFPRPVQCPPGGPHRPIRPRAACRKAAPAPARRSRPRAGKTDPACSPRKETP